MTRTRDSIQGPDYTGDEIVTVVISGNVTEVNKGPQIKYLKSSSITDEVTPNFRRRIAQGEIINNPMSMQVTTKISRDSTFSAVMPDASWSSSGGSTFRRFHEDSGYPGYNVIATDPSPNLDVARLHALANIDSTPYSFAEDLAELGTTFKWLKGKAWSFEKAARRYKKEIAKLRRKAKSLQHLSKAGRARWLANATADLWLEYRFVFMPLARSITDGLEAYNTKTKPRPVRLTARGKSETENSDGGVYVSYNADPLLEYHSKWSSKEHMDCRAGILYEITNPSHGFRFKYGLRNKDIPVTLWNVVRLSFMIDRFVNISASLKALTNLADPKIKILTAWTTRRHSFDVKFKFEGAIDNRPYPATWVFSGDNQEDNQFVYTRTPWVPTVSDAIPSFNFKGLVSDVTSVTDLFALGIKALESTRK